MPYAPAFMRRAPPMVPGTPISPSIPPRSFFAQKVTVRPRSAAASICAKLPDRTTSGSGFTSVMTTHGSSPSPTSRFDPPPRNLCGTPCCSSRFSKSGMPSCFLMRSKSVVPPIPSDVSSDRACPGRSSTPSSGNAASIFGFSMRMVKGMLRSEQGHQLVAGAADIARTYGQNSVARPCFLEQVFDALLHGREIEDVFVAGLANRFAERFARNARDGLLACGVNVSEDKNVRLIERPAEVVPERLGARVAVWLEENERAIELRGARRLQRRFDLHRVMAVVVNHRDAVDDAFHVKATANT